MIDLKKYNQEQILRYYDELGDEEKKILLKQIDKIDFDFMNKLYINSYTDEEIDMSKISNLNIITNLNNEEKEKYQAIGKEIVKNNEYGIVLFAGGFASRLNLNIPKGCLKININNKNTSLFELYLNRIKEVNKELDSKIRIYIMTSEKNNDEIIDFFEKNDYFNYDKSLITFFKQDKLPILDVKGKIVLKSKYEVLFGPNGNGDVFKALKENNIIEKMKKDNIKYLLFSTIDNVLSKLVDYEFIGATIKNGYEIGTKTLFKEDSNAKDWVFCKYNNHPFMLPGSYQDEEFNNEKDENGEFKYREKNITYHLVSLDKVEYFANIDLKYHRAYKNNNFLDESGNLMDTEDLNSFKFEKFIFDAFYFSDDMLLFRVDKNEFCPIKKKEDIEVAENILNNKNVQ